MRLRILQPCHENWDAMDPADAGRFCHACTREVHDLSAMTEREATRLLAARRGQRLCVRARLRPDGRAVFRPDPPRVLPAAAALALAACAPHTPEARELPPAAEREPAAPDTTVIVIPEAPPQPLARAPEPDPPRPTRPEKVKKPKKPEPDDMLMGYMDADF